MIFIDKLGGWVYSLLCYEDTICSADVRMCTL